MRIRGSERNGGALSPLHFVHSAEQLHEVEQACTEVDVKDLPIRKERREG